MPTYQYACTECGHGFEAVQSFHDSALTECPQCAGLLRKVFNSVGIVFKGSGFYRTDSREKKAGGPDRREKVNGEAKKPEGGKSEGDKSEGDKSEGGKSDGKSAASRGDNKPAPAGGTSSASSASTSTAGSAA